MPTDTDAGLDITAPITLAKPGTVEVPHSCRSHALTSLGGTGCATTRFTIDRSMPNLLSPQYAAPLPITQTTLRFFSVDVAGNSEVAKTEQYTARGPLPEHLPPPLNNLAALKSMSQRTERRPARTTSRSPATAPPSIR